MYLKALELHGFKSFPEKTRLVFEKPISAVVGPNGSGKSNISDAIRWAMGEQSSKTLRGGKMEDVIFGGTEKRSQMGFAEVSMIFDNSEQLFDIDSSEVMVTRRYYRSGDSEYYINKKPVRLRDVHELFMDTGLGRDGYSIIGQGRIDEVLSVRSTDRREIFEEAAGISRFRYRKEEAERKLERADDNLVRVNDKVSELELQVNPLRKQAEIAKKYLFLRDELRGLEISLWMHNLDNLNLQSEKLKSDYEAAKAKTEAMRSNIEQLYARSEQLLEERKAKDLDTEYNRQLISEIEAALAELESNVAVLKNNFRNNLESIERIENEIKQSEGRDDGLNSQINERKQRLTVIDEEKADTVVSVEALEAESSKLDGRSAEAEDKLNVLLRQESELIAKEAGEKAKISSAAAALQESEDRSSALIAELNGAEDRLTETENGYKSIVSRLSETKEAVQTNKNIINGYNFKVEGRRKKAEAVKEKSVKLTMEQNALVSRIAMLYEMEKEYQGYSKAVKFVMQEASRGILKNVYGTVAELVKTDDKYTVAIEIALGAAMQNIIVATEDDGKMGINALKRRDIGRATFSPVSSIKGQRLNASEINKEEGFEGVAVDLVKFNKRFEGIYTNLLGRTVIAKNLDSAVEIARKNRYRFRIVTLDGQMLNAGGSMTGGSVSRNTGILSRANEIEHLREHEAELSKAVSEAERELAQVQRELTAAEYELAVASEELRRYEDTVLKLEGEKTQCEMLIKAAQEYKTALNSESLALEIRIKNSADVIDASQKMITSINAELAKLHQQTAELSIGREEITGQKRGIINKISDLKVKIASLDAEKEAVTNSVRELDTLRIDLAAGKDQQKLHLEDIRLQNEQILLSIADSEKLIAENRAKAEEYKEVIAELNKERTELEMDRMRTDRELQESNRQLLDLERDTSRAEQKRISAEMEEKQIIDKLWDTYELSRSNAMLIRQQLENTSEASRKISELKREISKLGTPNIGAIDEFERVNSRYTYLTEQRDDIEKSKAELNGIIKDITAEMKNIFSKEFELINQSFKETFAELFGGGKASLELEDENDILNCGIEIKVQPPGKSLKNISLLSGGEKAFVASALYFAILKVKPTPFVIMDEIEAALDDANVVRFANYLRTLTDKTQFIIITHKRSTMEEADVLYGVTMQEKGVSKVLMIDLEEAGRTIFED